MWQDYLQPIPQALVEVLENLPSLAIGNTIKIHTEGNFPDITTADVAFVTINEGEDRTTNIDFYDFREKLYRLYPGNWDCKIVDLGILQKGSTQQDTFFALKKMQQALLKKEIPLLVLGGTQELVYPLYRSYDQFDQKVNITSTHKKIDLTGVKNEEHYMSRIILEEPHNLQNYSNLGYQTYYNSQEEIQLVEQLFFDAYRLGEITQDVALVEPIFRDADIASFNLQAISSSNLGVLENFSPNGFDGREICALARYAGLSEKVKTYAILGIDEKNVFSELLPQIFWYIVEGINYRVVEYPFSSKENYYKYTVLQEEQELVFFKSDKTGRWWIEIEHLVGSQKKKTLFPCSEKDYEKALDNETPERWWKALQKLSV